MALRAAKNCSKNSIAFEQALFDLGREFASRFASHASADARQGIADQHVDDPAAAVAGGHQHRACRLLANFSDDAGFLAAGSLRATHRAPHQRSREPPPPETGLHWRCATGRARAIRRRRALRHAPATGLPADDCQAAIARQFVQRRGDAAARRITHPANPGRRGREQGLDQRKHGASVGAQVGFEVEIPARQQNRDSVIADRAGKQHFVAGSHRVRGSMHTPRKGVPIPVVVTYMRSALPCSTTLVSPPAIARLRAGRLSHGANFGFQDLGGKASFKHKSDNDCLGLAPETARSLTVPLTASSPIEPPGKARGLTTKLSVVMATCAPSTATRAASASGSELVPNSRGANRPSTKRRLALPPAPCAISIWGSRNLTLGRSGLFGFGSMPASSGWLPSPCGVRSCSTLRKIPPMKPSALPSGCSGVHSFPNSLHCAGLSTPFSTSPHCAALGSVTRTPGTWKRCSESHSA